jgi:DNA-binding HxlR family transcriptional regulator
LGLLYLTFEVGETRDIIRTLVLLSVKKGCECETEPLRKRIEHYIGCPGCVEPEEFENTLNELSEDGLINRSDGKIALTEKGYRLSEELKNLLFKDEPVLEVVAGLTDGSITALIVTLSTFLAGLSSSLTVFTAALTLSAVSMTNFSSFILGGKTEDLADLISLKNLMEYSVNGIEDGEERDKSLILLKSLFAVLKKEISRSNLFSAVLCGVTTFLSGIIPISLFVLIPPPFGIIASLVFVGIVVGIFLARYRSKKMKVRWRVTLVETVALVIISVAVALLIGGFA